MKAVIIILILALACSTGPILTPKSKRTLRVMVIDSGVNVNIPEIRKYLNYYNPILMKDEVGHGSHVTGIIASKACPGVEIIPCAGVDDFDRSQECLNWALNLKVDLVNFSMGSYTPAEDEFKIIQKLEAAKIQVIAAAGNDGLDLNKHPFFPASYPLANIVTVGALIPNGQRAYFTNYREFITWEQGYKIESFNKDGKRVEM